MIYDIFVIYWIAAFAIYAISIIYCYAKGMGEYVELNKEKTDVEEIRRMRKCIDIEYKELVHEILKCNIVGIILELFDVLHGIIAYVTARFISLKLLRTKYYWLVVFWFVIPVGIKHGHRYYYHNCIRNHKNSNNLDHKCNYSKYYVL